MLNSQWSSSTEIQRFDQLNNYTSSETPQFAQWEYGPQKRWMNSIVLIGINPTYYLMNYMELHLTNKLKSLDTCVYLIRKYKKKILKNIQISGFTINANKFFFR